MGSVAPGVAQSFSDSLQNAARVALLPGYLHTDGAIRAGVQIDLAPGWKTYWREPGSNGIAPEFDWSGSTNVADVQIHWPVPEIMTYEGDETIGFAHQVVLPLTVTPIDVAMPVDLQLALDFGVCEKVCVPWTATTSERLGYGSSDLIDMWMTRLPVPAAEAGMIATDCELKPAEADFSLVLDLGFEGPAPHPEAVLIETGSAETWVAASSYVAEPDKLRVSATLMHFGEEGTSPDPSTLRFTVVGDGFGIDLIGC